MHCGPVGEEGTGDKAIQNIVDGIVHKRFEEPRERSVCALSLSIALRVVGRCVGFV